MDAETQLLIERARQRRELLNQKMGRTPEAAPRKRQSPLAEHVSHGNVREPDEESCDDSGKRLRMHEHSIKPDTPAIPSVQSRLKNLASIHAQWSDKGDEEMAPVPAPRKSLTSPPLGRKKVDSLDKSAGPNSQRKNRFAELASTIDNWHDDLSRPSKMKEDDENRIRWQPPKNTLATGTHASSPKKKRAPPPPTTCTSKSVSSPVKTPVTSVPSMSRKVGNDLPSNKVGFNSTPKPFQPYSQRSPLLSSVKSPSSSKSNIGMRQDLEKASEMSGAESQGITRGKETPRVAPKPSVANLKNKILEPANLTVSASPNSRFHNPSFFKTVEQTHTIEKPLPSPVKEDSVCMRPKVRKSIDDEPTAHPVSARMSAWEQISTAQVVSDIKKVRPGKTTPVKTAGPTHSPSKMSPMKLKTSMRATPSKVSSVTPSKSFKDSIKERAALVNPSTAAVAEESSPTGKNCSLSPRKASCAMRAVQQQLVQQTQSTSMAEKLRQERMAELQSIQDRWQNGILKPDEELLCEQPKPEAVLKTDKCQPSNQVNSEYEKLESVSSGVPEDRKKGFHEQIYPKIKTEMDCNSSCPPKAPPAPPAPSVTKVAGKQPHKNTLYHIVSQKKKAGAGSPISTPNRDTNNRYRKVKFDDGFDSDTSDVSPPEQQNIKVPETKHTADRRDDTPESDSDVSDDSYVEMPQTVPSDFEHTYHQTRVEEGRWKQSRPSHDDDDLSLSAFVPASVRRQSILPSPQKTVDSHQSTGDHLRLGYNRVETESSSSLDSQSSTENNNDLAENQPQSGYCPEDTEDSVDDREAVGDLLDEAMDSDSSVSSASIPQPQTPVMRKRSSHRKATEDGSLPFSINDYRASRNMQTIQVKQTIVRNSKYTKMDVKEEEVEMPTHAPTPAPRQSLQERIRELQELVQQEQSVILQTSNALTQCCSSASYFAGSSEEVECNRILLIASQKRQAYMMEIQQLRESRTMESTGSGPKGSLTISDIRLPLRKDFVTKIGTSQDTVVHFFILLVRNGSHIMSTQMLSTHDPMMRGSLDFPNLIKINGITGTFKVKLEIYSMSVCHEPVGKGKKKKTPKKAKSSTLTAPSPGHAPARTTSFSQVTSIQLNMRSLDKHSFNLERLSHLSPLHGMIYMNIKCLMEANVEERGFLTMFEDVSGFGSWHRRWCALSGNKLQYWKYPDDETRKDAMGYIDLKRCVTEKVGLVSRDICARPHTFELVTVRQPRRGEKDTLVSRTYNTMTTIRHMLSADTKEERIMWCNKINRSLANIRTWHSDAMRPIPKKT